MRCSAAVPAALLFTVFGCTEPTRPSEERFTAVDAPLADARIRVGTGGFDDANNVGSLPGSQWSPSPWTFLPNSGSGDGESFGTPDECNLFGRCHVGDLALQWGTLGLSPFPDHNLDPNGSPSTSFGVLMNVGFFPDPSSSFVRTIESGIQTVIEFPPAAPNQFLEFQIDAAFGTGQKDTGPGYDDYAVVEFVVGTTVTEILRWSRNDLQPGGQGAVTARSRTDCGTVTIGGTPQSYPLCTDWERHIVPVDQFGGSAGLPQNVLVRVRIVRAAPADNDESSFLAIDNVNLDAYDLTDVTLQILAGNRLTRKHVEVAILGDGTFPVNTVDMGSLTLQGVGIARLSNGTPLSNFSDVNRDGIMDVIGRFDRQAVLATGTFVNGGNPVQLKGMFIDRSRLQGTGTLIVP